MYGHNHTYDYDYDYSLQFPEQQQPLFLQPPDSTVRRTHSSSSQQNIMYSPPTAPPSSYFECQSTSADLLLQVQGVNLQCRTPLVNESTIIDSINRANPYSPQEKKERILRYRTKRNLRNFNKKIKYECRKTLADSRPRIRGRFARNDETKTPQAQWDHNATTLVDQDHQDDVEEEEEEEYYHHDDQDNWINFLDAFSANLMP